MRLFDIEFRVQQIRIDYVIFLNNHRRISVDIIDLQMKFHNSLNKNSCTINKSDRDWLTFIH